MEQNRGSFLFTVITMSGLFMGFGKLTEKMYQDITTFQGLLIPFMFLRVKQLAFSSINQQRQASCERCKIEPDTDFYPEISTLRGPVEEP